MRQLQTRFLSEELPRLMFVLLPIFALLIKIVFPRRLYFDHVIFSVHLHSAAYVVLALLLPFEIVTAENPVVLAIQILFHVYALGYFIIALRRVYAAGWLVTTSKSLLVIVGYLVVVSAVIEATSTFRILGD